MLKPVLSLCLVLMVLSVRTAAIAQVQTDLIIEQIIEAYAAEQNDDTDYSELAERLNRFLARPLQLNSATEEELKDLIFLSAMQQHALLEHIRQNGELIEWYELQSVDGFDRQTIEHMMLFTTLASQPVFERFRLNQLLRQGTHDLMLRYGQIVQQQEGFRKDSAGYSTYQGSPQKYLLRYRYAFGNMLQASLNAEKDAGEPFFGQGQAKGFDFYSGNLFYRGKGLLKRAVLGDYNLQLGQGLAMWTGMSFGSGTSVAAVIRQESGLRPYTSFNEGLFLRGISATAGIGRFSITPFFSYRRLAATLDDAGMVSTIVQSGLHRSLTEQAAKGRLGQWVYGASAEARFNSLKIGVVAYHSLYDLPLAPGRALYDQYSFSGKALGNASLYFGYRYRNVYTYGEAAHSMNGGFAWLAGLAGSLSHRLSLILACRNYQKDYHSFYSQGFAQSAQPVNERGLYTGLEYRAASRLVLAFFADRFEFPWLKFRVDAPSRGYSLSAQALFTPNKRLKLSARYRYLFRQENDELVGPAHALADVARQNYRLELNYQPDRNISLRNRAEILRYRKDDRAQYGFMIYQDVLYNPMQSRLSGNVRLALFDTAGFDSRIYTYENDVLYSYSLGAYQDRGIRYYANLRYSVSRSADLWLRYAHTAYHNRETVSSGADEIAGNARSDIRVQLRLRW